MEVALTETEHQPLRQLQKQQRDDAGYVKVTVILLLDKKRSASSIADDLGLDDSTVYRYAQAWQHLGPDKYLVHEAPGYWGLLPSAGLAALCREVEQTLYADMRPLGAWLQRHLDVAYSHSGLMQLLHRLGFMCKLTTPAPYEADAGRQGLFLAEELGPLLARPRWGRPWSISLSCAWLFQPARRVRTRPRVLIRPQLSPLRVAGYFVTSLNSN